MRHSEFSVESDRQRFPFPMELAVKQDGSLGVWMKRWWSSVEGHAYRRDYFSARQVKLQPDGSIRIDDVPSGNYLLELSYFSNPSASDLDSFTYATVRFTIPEIRSDEPVDLGVLRPKAKVEVPDTGVRDKARSF